ncbi:MAG: rod shape-determining protein MreC, partial [Betaproteobacteria bacterium]|nr:rod shape-determining protein MreC [Betaproteobacteria bacterium]
MQGSAPPLFRQGLPATIRFIGFALAAVALAWMDSREHWLHPLRSSVVSVLLPMEEAVSAPGDWWRLWVSEVRQAESLREENRRLQTLLASMALVAQRDAELDQENRSLRALMQISPRKSWVSRAAQITSERRDSYVRRLTINKGLSHGVTPGHAVMDAQGLIGQVTRSYQRSAEVTAMTDPSMAVPVLNQRNGQRAVLFGSGSAGVMELKFIASSAEMQIGDVLLTSGVDGVFPPGVLTGVVHQIDRNPGSPFPRILVKPAGGIDSSRIVLIVGPDTVSDKPHDEDKAQDKGNERDKARDKAAEKG